jgi:hypothetical protein
VGEDLAIHNWRFQIWQSGSNFAGRLGR